VTRLTLLFLLALTGCTAARGPNAFAAPGPAFDPLAFFDGHVTSWGVEENRAGQPIAIVTTDCVGRMTGPGRLAMVQTLHVGSGPAQIRHWTLWRAGPGRYEATANDMDGAAFGVASGRNLHWRWVLESKPGHSVANVTMDQNFYQMDDGAVMIRTIVTKFGVRLVEVSEQFERRGN